MKKLAFMFVAAAAMSFASCNNQTKATDEAEDSVVVEEEVSCDSVCCGDSTCCDSVVAE